MNLILLLLSRQGYCRLIWWLLDLHLPISSFMHLFILRWSNFTLSILGLVLLLVPFHPCLGNKFLLFLFVSLSSCLFHWCLESSFAKFVFIYILGFSRSGGLQRLVRFHTIRWFFQLLFIFGRFLISWPLHTSAAMIMQLEGMTNTVSFICDMRLD